MRIYRKKDAISKYRDVIWENPNVSKMSDISWSREALYDADFIGMDLNGVNFYSSNLIGSVFVGASLLKTNFVWAKLNGADFKGANCINTNFRYSCLRGVSFKGANLVNCQFGYSTLCGADFTGANVQGGEFYGTSFDDSTKFHDFQIPQNEELIVWKKLRSGRTRDAYRIFCIAKLLIRKEWKRTAGLGGCGKNRAEAVEVLEIRSLDDDRLLDRGYSLWNSHFEYKPKDVVRPKSYSDDIRDVCMPGIHFFMTREEAESFVW